MKKYYVVDLIETTVTRAKKLADLLEARGFDTSLDIADSNPFSIIVDVNKHTFLVVYNTKVELFYKKRVEDDFAHIRTFDDFPTFRPAQIIHAIIDLTKSANG